VTPLSIRELHEQYERRRADLTARFGEEGTDEILEAGYDDGQLAGTKPLEDMNMQELYEQYERCGAGEIHETN
jgi:hypothetical protein